MIVTMKSQKDGQPIVVEIPEGWYRVKKGLSRVGDRILIEDPDAAFRPFNYRHAIRIQGAPPIIRAYTDKAASMQRSIDVVERALRKAGIPCRRMRCHIEIMTESLMKAACL